MSCCYLTSAKICSNPAFYEGKNVPDINGGYPCQCVSFVKVLIVDNHHQIVNWLVRFYNTYFNYRCAVEIMLVKRANGRREWKLGATRFRPELPSPLSRVLGELHSNREMVTLPSILARIPKELLCGTSTRIRTDLARQLGNDIFHLEALMALLTTEINSTLSVKTILKQISNLGSLICYIQ